MDKQIIINSAEQHYKKNIEGEPLTEKVPIESYIAGAEFIIKTNEKNYKNALKNLKPIQKAMIDMRLNNEWMLIVNSLRLCAGMELIKLKNKSE
jgi:hypothetical protein